MHENITGLILLFLREGSTRDAVELYCEETGSSREEARCVVAQLAEQHGLSPRRWFPGGLLRGIGWLAAFRTAP
jgi:hypothetical protein